MLQTLILCGGKGTRLRPLTAALPKPLIPLNNKPCLEHILESYIKKGYHRFILCIGYRGEMIVDFVHKRRFPAEIQFSDAGEEASLLQRLYEARSLIEERAFVSYGDTLIDIDLTDMLAQHQKAQSLLTLATASVRTPFGLIRTDRDNCIIHFEEKPIETYFVGQMLFERSVLDQLDPELLKIPDGGGLIRLIQQLIQKRAVLSYPYQGPQITFNTRQELGHAESELFAFFTHDEGGDHEP